MLTAVLIAEATQRLGSGEAEDHPHAWLVIVMAVLSGVANLIKIWLLHSDAMHSLNVRAIYVHVMADMFASVGALLVGIWLLCDQQNHRVEPIVTLVIGVVIVGNAMWVLVPSVQTLRVAHS